MKYLATLTFVLLSTLSIASPANELEKLLQDTTWHQTRDTGIGKVVSTWTFDAGGKGKATQKVTKHDKTKQFDHTFTYHVDNNKRVIIQEEIDDAWKGHFGVTRWTLVNGKLIHDVNFRNKEITLTPKTEPKIANSTNNSRNTGMSFLESFTLQNDPIHIALIQLGLAFVMASILRIVYIRFGTSISNRKAFSVNFFLLAMTITFIITIVKSSLALSLGLVGALSIVRFRSAIKEPEELAYLFITIAIGIGLGANQILLTTAAFIIIVAAIVLTSLLRKDKNHGSVANLSILLNVELENAPTLEQLTSIVKEHSKQYTVRRFIQDTASFDVGIACELSNESDIDQIRKKCANLNSNLQINYLNPQSIAL